MYRPAIVYTSENSDREAMDEVLDDRRWYRFDDLPELEEDVALPVPERPILRRQFIYINRNFASDGVSEPRGLDDEGTPKVFVTDALRTLGADKVSQAGVVGAMLQFDVEVYLMDQPLKDWYRRQVSGLGFEVIDRVIDAVNEDVDADMIARWQRRKPEQVAFLPTTWRGERSYANAARLAHDLGTTGLPLTTIARRLSVDGYRNSKGRVIWYPQNVKALLASAHEPA